MISMLLMLGIASAQEQTPSSDVEIIVRLHRALEDKRKQLKEIANELENPESEYEKALLEFRDLDEERARLEAESKEKPEAATELKKLMPEWQEARKRFELAFQERRALQNQATVIKDLITEYEQELAALTDPPTTKPENAEPSSPEPPVPTPATEPPATPLPGVPDVPSESPAEPTAPEPDAEEAPELTEARQRVEEKEQIAQDAEEKARTIEERIASVRTSIDAAQQRIATARQLEDLSRETKTKLEAELRTKLADQAPAVELRELRDRIQEQAARLREAIQANRRGRDALSKAQLELSVWQGEQISALQESGRARAEADVARRELAELENPFSLSNVLQWLLNNGPKVLIILFIMVVLGRVVALSSRSVARLIVKQRRNSDRLQDRAEAERAQTLASVYRYAATVLIYTVGSLTILEAIGISVTTLLGGAAVIGLAVSFGAQSLIKDYFTGFMILAEDQFAVGDVISVGDSAGVVEDITLRVTRLRDLDGQVHFIPNGEIRGVINMTHGWSRALFEIGVAYKEDIGRVIDVLMELAQEMRHDKRFGPMILDEPEMLGVERFDDSAVVVRFFLKTAPSQQWGIRRALNRRIKDRFDELGIEIPFPHRTVYHRSETETLTNGELATGSGIRN